MRNYSDIFQKLLLLLGNRIGFILIVGITVALLLVENTEPAMSSSELTNSFTPSEQMQGLTFNPATISDIQFQSSSTLPTPTPNITIEPTPTITPSPTPQQLLPTPVQIESVQIDPTPTMTIADLIPTSTPQIDVNGDTIWDALAQCESGGNWSINTGNGYFGGLQFSQGAWNSVGGSGEPHNASREEQISRGKLLQEKRGWGAWGLCAKKLGLN